MRCSSGYTTIEEFPSGLTVIPSRSTGVAETYTS